MRIVSRMLLALALVAAVAPSLAAQARGDERTRFFERENSLWSSVKNKELPLLGKVFTADYVAVYDSGIVGKKDELGGIEQATLRSVRLDDFTLHNVDGLNVLVSYKAVVDGDMNGKSMAGTYNTMTLWHRTGNQWYVAAHTEVKAP
jgi:hypothetical protein